MDEKIIRQYLRDEKGNPIGCMVALLDDGELLIGVSKHAGKKESAPFTKQGAYDRALFKATGRSPLYKEWYVMKTEKGTAYGPYPFYINCATELLPTFPMSRKKEVENFITKCCKRFDVDFCANYKKMMVD